MNKHYDLIVLGSGGAGYRVAMRTAQAGWKVAVIEENKIWGGTCDNRGCMPKKVLVGAAEMADMNRRYQGLGVVTKPAELDWGALIKFKSTFTDPVSAETKEPLEKAGVELYEGSPKFVSEDTVEVNGEQLTAKHFHIATGAKPAKLTLEGAECLATSDDFLNLTSLPKRIVFVGGGIVGNVGVPTYKDFKYQSAFSRNVGLRGGIAPARQYIPELLDDVLAGRINPGRVFDLTVELKDIKEAYAAMDERRAIKSLLKVSEPDEAAE